MKAQQLGQDYFLWFDRRGERALPIGASRSFRGGELDIEPGRVLETDLLNSGGKSSGKKAFLIREENEGENGILPSFNSNGDLEVRMGKRAYPDYLGIHNEIVAPFPGTGDAVVRILYKPYTA